MVMGTAMAMAMAMENTQGRVTMRKKKLSIKSGIILTKRNVANNTPA